MEFIEIHSTPRSHDSNPGLESVDGRLVFPESSLV